MIDTSVTKSRKPFLRPWEKFDEISYKVYLEREIEEIEKNAKKPTFEEELDDILYRLIFL